MNPVDKIKMLCKERGVSFAKLERECGFSNGYIGSLKTTLQVDRLEMIADYFNVPVEDFFKNEEEPKEYYVDKDAADIAQEIFENPYMRTLFHAAKGIEPRRLQLVTNILLDFKETNPNG